ncbi:4-phosphoerythronate dehydrogenase [Parahaliea mediterranea]|uniref:Erythronate-4-phosphate dehydrogenase n=1 Tax=Parahaliea mediterranea TaxID=651086 RepID=A0A939ILY4_9GAMM|nr:4-phosphoerythronate dehydrogenase [Parahaliea mediterranea]MBN7798856.1 4-phosphoerythronate dehydrogenase [Parahaliea mediterranea]
MSGLRIVADANMRGVEEVFARYGDIDFVEGRALRPSQLADTDVLLVRSVTVVDSALLGDSGVRFVGTATSGLEHIDRAYLDEHGIRFAHARGANANSVVEYALAAIAASGDYLERLLAGAPLGIVGHGHVGAGLARCARALGIVTRVCDPWQEAVPDAASLEQVLGCEVICLHPELTRRAPWPSYHLLGAERLALVPDGALLINASRGAVVDNAALLARLARSPRPRCVLDVWEHEPWISRELLGEVQLGSAHIAGYSLDAKLAATRLLGVALAEAFDLEAPPADAGVPPAAVLALESPGSDTEALRQLLLGRYDIVADDRALRGAVLGAARDDVGPAFDGLRRHYPERRELRGSPVYAPGLPDRFQRALGYRPVEREWARPDEAS